MLDKINKFSKVQFCPWLLFKLLLVRLRCTQPLGCIKNNLRSLPAMQLPAIFVPIVHKTSLKLARVEKNTSNPFIFN
jgi:hypothetical protein